MLFSNGIMMAVITAGIAKVIHYDRNENVKRKLKIELVFSDTTRKYI